jgi:hypothetical protein
VQQGGEVVGVACVAPRVVQHSEAAAEGVGEEGVRAHRFGEMRLVDAGHDHDRSVVERQLEPAEQLDRRLLRLLGHRLPLHGIEQQAHRGRGVGLLVEGVRQPVQGGCGIPQPLERSEEGAVAWPVAAQRTPFVDRREGGEDGCRPAGERSPPRHPG